ncbi:MAG: hypothetical protein RL660_1622 [Bacteroidota bacterium]|jgi:site-specific DNA-methyltransferase (adenine-specific)
MPADKKRAPRNRTLSLSKAEEKAYAKKLVCTLPKTIKSISALANTSINMSLYDVLPYLPPNSFDLIIVDPPYNLDKDFHGFKFKSSKHSTYADYLRSFIPMLANLLKPTGSMYLCGDWKSTSALQEVLSENLHVINRISWQREKGRGAKRNWKNGMEDIWFAVKDEKQYYFDVDAVKMKRRVLAPYKQDGEAKDWEASEDGNFRLTYPSNFWDDISIPYWSMPENTDHPTQKPEKLIAKLILSSCPVNGIVLDPFLGSGTTSVVAKKLDRQYVGIDFNKDYCLWAEKRLAQAETDTAIQGYTDGVFWERNTLAAQAKHKTSKKKA